MAPGWHRTAIFKQRKRQQEHSSRPLTCASSLAAETQGSSLPGRPARCLLVRVLATRPARGFSAACCFGMRLLLPRARVCMWLELRQKVDVLSKLDDERAGFSCALGYSADAAASRELSRGRHYPQQRRTYELPVWILLDFLPRSYSESHLMSQRPLKKGDSCFVASAPPPTTTENTTIHWVKAAPMRQQSGAQHAPGCSSTNQPHACHWAGNPLCMHSNIHLWPTVRPGTVLRRCACAGVGTCSLPAPARSVNTQPAHARGTRPIQQRGDKQTRDGRTPLNLKLKPLPFFAAGQGAHQWGCWCEGGLATKRV